MVEILEEQCPHCRNFVDVLVSKSIEDERVKIKVNLEQQDPNRWEGRTLMKQFLKEKGLY